MDILPEAAEINGASAQVGTEQVELAGAKRLMNKGQTVDDAGFAGAVCPENKRYRLYRYLLRFRKRFEIAKMKRVDHFLSPKMPMPLPATPFPEAVLSSMSCATWPSGLL
jgi:hypothetical protein